MHATHRPGGEHSSIRMLKVKGHRRHFDIPESGFLEKHLNFCAIGQAANGFYGGGGFCANISFERRRLRLEHWIDIQFSLNTENCSPPGFQHPSQFPKRCQLVGEELQGLLADGEIEPIVGKRKCGGIGLHPFDIQSSFFGERSSHAKHLGTMICCREITGTGQPFCKLPCHDTGAAGEIQDIVTRLWVGAPDQLFCPWLENDRDQHSLIPVGKSDRLRHGPLPI